jgi:hypothetical protein
VPPDLILMPTMVAARALAVLAWPFSRAQEVIGSADDVSQRLRRWADSLPTAPPARAWLIVIAVAAGVLVAPLLLLLGIAAVFAARSVNVNRR